jgi:hypothetical protein
MVSDLKMSRTCATTITILMALQPAISFGQRADRPPSATPGRPIDIRLCELVAKPQLLNEETIRVRATVLRGPESTILFDKSCYARVYLAWPEEDLRGRMDGSLEYAFIHSEGEAKYPARLKWHHPPAPIKLLENDMFKSFFHLLMAEQPERPGILCVSCPLNSVTATFTGRFEYASMIAIRGRSKQIETVDAGGFGHLNMWDSQLVVQSVSDVDVKPDQ